MRRGTCALWGDVHSPNGTEGAPEGEQSLRRGNAELPPKEVLKKGDVQRAFRIQGIYYLLDRRWKKYPPLFTPPRTAHLPSCQRGLMQHVHKYRSSLQHTYPRTSGTKGKRWEGKKENSELLWKSDVAASPGSGWRRAPPSSR